MPLTIPTSTGVPREKFTPVAGRQLRETDKRGSVLPGLAEQAIQVAGAISEKQDEQDRITANNAYIALQQQSNISLYGKDGFYRTSGQTSFQQTGPARVNLENINEKISSGLTQSQRKYYNLNSQKFLLRSNLGITKHEKTQTRVAKSSSLTSQAENAIASGSLDYSEDSLRDEASSVMIAVGDLANMNGLGSEARLSMLNGYNSKLYFGAAQGALAHDDFGRVQQIIDQHGDSILPNHLISLKRALKTRYEANNQDNIKDESYAIVDTTFNGNVNLKKNIDSARHYAGDALTPELARQIDADVKSKQNEFKIVTNQEHTAQYSELAERIYDGTPFNKITNKELIGMSSEEVSSLQKIRNTGFNNNDVINNLSKLTKDELRKTNIPQYVAESGLLVDANGLKKAVSFQEKSNKESATNRQKVHGRADKLIKEFKIPEVSVGMFDDVPDKFEGLAVNLNSNSKKQEQTQLMRSKTAISIVSAQLIDDEITKREVDGETTDITDNEIRDIFYKASWTNDYNVGIKDIPPNLLSKIINVMKSQDIENIPGKTREETIMSIFIKYTENGSTF